MIKITMANGNVVTWDEKAYTDYKYDRKFFIIIRGEQWVGFYNLAHVLSIEVFDSDAYETNEDEPDDPQGDLGITEEEIDDIFKALRIARRAPHG